MDFYLVTFDPLSQFLFRVVVLSVYILIGCYHKNKQYTNDDVLFIFDLKPALEAKIARVGDNIRFNGK